GDEQAKEESSHDVQDAAAQKKVKADVSPLGYVLAMRRHARSKWPALLAVGVGLTGATLGWLLVRRDAQRAVNIGFAPGPEWGFVAFLLVGLGIATYFLSRRLFDGPTLTRTEWSVTFMGAIAARVADLTAALSRRGYSIEVTELDDAAEPLRIAHSD